MDGEIVSYTCKNSVYRFRQDGAEKEDWKDTFDVECGWENKWNPPEVYGCVDIRGCSEPPPRYILSICRGKISKFFGYGTIHLRRRYF